MSKHIRFGWRILFFFALLGVGLEVLHALKLRWYLDASSETRRTLFTLAHAHGVLLALINFAFGLVHQAHPILSGRRLSLASTSLIGSTLLLPSGFFLGGLVTYGGDPGWGIFLVPIGAAMLILSLFLLAAET